MKVIKYICYENSDSKIENNNVLFSSENMTTQLIINFPSSFVGYSKSLDLVIGGIKTQLLNLGNDNSIAIELVNSYFAQGDLIVQAWCSKVDEQYPDDTTKIHKQIFKEQTIKVYKPQYASDEQFEYPDSIAQLQAMISQLKTNTSAWYDGKGIPSSDLGLNNDYYLNTVNGDLYKKIDGIWKKSSNMRGPQGEQGVQGIQGVAGPVGETGSKGDSATITVGNVTSGAPGTSASITNSGTNTNAIFNFTIPRGEKGDTGATGPQGPIGPIGPQGPAGTSGSSIAYDIGIEDAGNYYNSNNVEGALQEIGYALSHVIEAVNAQTEVVQ